MKATTKKETMQKAKLAIEQPFALVAQQVTQEAKPEVKSVTPATKVMKDLINERLDKMTFIQLALLLAYLIEKK